MSKYVTVYVDKGLTTPLPTTQIDGEEIQYLMFGNLDIDQEKTFPFYLENRSTGIIEDLEITPAPVTRTTRDWDIKYTPDDIEVIIENSKADILYMAEIHPFYVSWRWDEDVKAGPLQVFLHITGVVANELV